MKVSERNQTYKCISHLSGSYQAFLHNQIQTVDIDNSSIDVSNNSVNRLARITCARFKRAQVRVKPRCLAAGKGVHVPETYFNFNMCMVVHCTYTRGSILGRVGGGG